MFNKIILSFLSLVALVFVPTVSAHVVVTPNKVNAGERVSFVVSVPTEEAVPTVSLRLVMPEGLKGVRPNVKPGWNIELKKDGEGEGAKTTEIIWTGGTIPQDQRDVFVFAAQAPASETSLIWKAYQTYGDGEVVAWETDPKNINEGMGHDGPKPYSITSVVNDLKADNAQVKNQTVDKNPTYLALVALALSAVSLGLTLRKRS